MHSEMQPRRMGRRARGMALVLIATLSIAAAQQLDAGAGGAAAAVAGSDGGPPAATPQAEAAGGAFDCAAGCTFDVRPVCGADGDWYQNECLAFCSGRVTAASADVCSGELAFPGCWRVQGARSLHICNHCRPHNVRLQLTSSPPPMHRPVHPPPRAGKPLPFLDSRNGPRGAESAGGQLPVPADVVTRFLEEGFKYVGRIRLARDVGPAPEPAAGGGAPEAPAAGPDGHWDVKAVRCTPEGDVYVGRCALFLGRGGGMVSSKGLRAAQKRPQTERPPRLLALLLLQPP